MAASDTVFLFSYQVVGILLTHRMVTIMNLSEDLNALEALGLAKWA